MSDTQPGEDPLYQDAMLQYLLGGGSPDMPYLNTAQAQTIYGAVPPSLNPGQQGNYLQDYLSIMMDPAVAAMFGSGAYGSDAFAPTATYEQVSTPGRDQLMRYLSRPGTIEAYIAEQILSGGTAASAVAELQQAHEANPDDPEVSALVGQLPMQEGDTGWETDWTAAGERFRSMEQTFMEDPVPGTRGAIIDPETGEVISPAEEVVEMVDEQGNPVLMRVEQEASPMAEWFRKRGLSLPTDTYTPEDLLGQQWAQGQGLVDDARTAFEQASQEYLAAEEAAARPSHDAEALAANMFSPGMMAQPGVERPADVPTSQMWNDPLASIQYRIPVMPTQTQNRPSADSLDHVYPEAQAQYNPIPSGAFEVTDLASASPVDFERQVRANWGTMTDEQRDAAWEYMMNNQLSGDLYDQGEWNQTVANLTPVFDGEEIPVASGASPDLLVPHATTAPVTDRRGDNETTGWQPPEGADYHDGAWYDRDGNLIGTAATEDSPNVQLVTPATYYGTSPGAYTGGGGGGGGGRPLATVSTLPWSILRQMPQSDDDGEPTEEERAARRRAYAQQQEQFMHGDENAEARRRAFANSREEAFYGEGSGSQNRSALRFLLDDAMATGRRLDQQQTEQRYQARDRARSGSLASFRNLVQQTGQTYGADYGRAAAQAWLMQQQGITPLQQQLAARRQVPIGMGLVGSGYLPGM